MLPGRIMPRLGRDSTYRVVQIGGATSIDAGGHRLTKEEAAEFKEKNADYIFREFVLELKILQEEGLSVSTRQSKIASLFASYPSAGPVHQLDPFSLTEEDFEEYLDIVGVPLKKRIQSASKQVKKTIERLGKDKYKGGVILLNTGYTTIPHDFLEYLGDRYASKDTSWISEVITISCWTMTNGFDSSINFSFSPHEPENETIGLLKESFWNNINSVMNEWASGGFMPPQEKQEPMEPVSFQENGKVFTFGVPRLESSMKDVTNKY